MPWKVLITSAPIAKVGQPAAARLQQAGCQLIHASKAGGVNGQELLDLLHGTDAVIAGSDQFSAAVLASPAAARLKIISRWGVGYDAIDIPAATAHGIVVAYTPGLTDSAVADFTFALLLALVRHIPEGLRSMRDGLWLPAWGHDMAGKTLGILGFGRIGQAVAQRARGFDLQIIAHNPTPKPAAENPGVQFVSFDELLARSDYLTLHAAAKPQNRGLLGEAQFRRMKPTAYLVNTARGALIDEPALLTALREGWITGAALDVFCEEPLPPQHPFRSAPNLLLSPHQASSSRETGERVSAAAVDAILDLLHGRPPKHLVNPEVLTSPQLRAPISSQ
ncbi:MAG: D-isomer specific 2-hydroxyacid dehydrogenase NAD-binding [Pedosphaera sp.]|nr:D-isomer specific 2-hydroxyacid dehydrogenase NAD-binding [Pedosphaera sp.]